MKDNEIKNNDISIVQPILFLLASVCFLFAAIYTQDMFTKGLHGIASTLNFASSVISFITYKKRMAEERQKRIPQNK